MRNLSLVLVVLAACKNTADSDTTATSNTTNTTDTTATVERVQSGTYTLDYASAGTMTTSDFGTATIDIDVDALTATVTQDDGSTVELTLTATPQSQWISDCYLNGSQHSLDEVYKVAPDPAVVQGLSIPYPILTTKCGGRVLLGTGGSNTVMDPTLGFSG